MKYAALFLIRAYKLCISPYLGDCCRFYPTCADYSADAFRQKGFCLACWLTFKRLLKCGPWHPGGVDEV